MGIEDNLLPLSLNSVYRKNHKFYCYLWWNALWGARNFLSIGFVRFWKWSTILRYFVERYFQLINVYKNFMFETTVGKKEEDVLLVSFLEMQNGNWWGWSNFFIIFVIRCMPLSERVTCFEQISNGLLKKCLNKSLHNINECEFFLYHC